LNEARIRIKALRQDKHYGSKKLIKMFPQQQWCRNVSNGHSLVEDRNF